MTGQQNEFNLKICQKNACNELNCYLRPLLVINGNFIC